MDWEQNVSDQTHIWISKCLPIPTKNDLSHTTPVSILSHLLDSFFVLFC